VKSGLQKEVPVLNKDSTALPSPQSQRHTENMLLLINKTLLNLNV